MTVVSVTESTAFSLIPGTKNCYRYFSANPKSSLPLHQIQRTNTSHQEDTVAALEEQSKQVVRQYVEAFNAGDMTKLKELLAPDAEIQGVLGKGNFDKISPIWQQLIDGYGMQLEIQELIANENNVAARYIERGTFKAPAFGIEPTGKSYELIAMEFFTIEDGKIARRWGARDAMSQAKQLSLPPFQE
jgi:steroid delta-isomerase-like uncharacterized protein